MVGWSLDLCEKICFELNENQFADRISNTLVVHMFNARTVNDCMVHCLIVKCVF